MKNPNRHCVLYADDDEDAGFLVSVTLGFSDIEVTIAKTITKAWDLAQNEYFDLYLLDSRFPDGHGLGLCRRLREYAPHTPIIFYSGEAYQEDIEKGLAAGADDYLTKPYFNDLAETILKAIKLSKQSAFKSSDNFCSSQKHINTAEA
jgi:DNA-binding response OmpR family regulator